MGATANTAAESKARVTGFVEALRRRLGDSVPVTWRITEPDGAPGQWMLWVMVGAAEEEPVVFSMDAPSVLVVPIDEPAYEVSEQIAVEYLASLAGLISRETGLAMLAAERVRRDRRRERRQERRAAMRRLLRRPNRLD